MTVTLIHTAPEPLFKNYIGRLYGNASLARGYIDGLTYARPIGFDVPRYEPVYGPLLERLKADKHAFYKFSTTHADELRSEREAEKLWQEQRAWAEDEKSKGYAELSAANKAAYEVEQLGRAINERAAQLWQAREAAERAQALADARAQLGGKP
jgi:hypothetical protein